MKYLFYLHVTFICLIIPSVKLHKHSSHPLLLLISFDGFRWDYLKNNNLVNFNSLKSNGSSADYIVSSFVTATFPNHWSIITGLYEESHGILHNQMYDRSLGKTFDIYNNQSKDQWFLQNSQAEPVWITNQKNGDGRRSASNWMGSDLKIHDQNIIHIPFNASASFNGLIDQFIQMFTSETDPINFGSLYFYEPDNTGHLYGPDSKEMKEKLQELDKTLGYLIEQLQSHHLYDKLNLIITSDHGMETIKQETALYLDSLVDIDLFDAYGRPACYNLFVKNESNINFVYEALKANSNIDVYKKLEFPEELHYKNNIRAGDIIIVAKLGYAIFLNSKTPIDWSLTNGLHGYYTNHSSMHPIFIAHGPAFKKNKKVDSFNVVDIYPLMCFLLGIQPAINNGSIYKVIDMVVYKEIDTKGKALLLLAIIPICIAAMSSFALCFKFCRKTDKINYDSYFAVSTTEKGETLDEDLDDDDENVFFKSSR